MAETKSTQPKEISPAFRGGLDFAAAQSDRILATYPDYTPMYTVGGKWNREGERWTHWCEGFFPGILWLLYRHTKDDKWLAPARKLSRALEPRQFDRNVHDLGFLFFSTYLREYNLFGEAHCRDVLIQAGRTLALRRQKGGYLASFIGPQSLFIDVMMNVGIIIYAANATGDAALRDVALEHCRTTQKYLVRADGGTAHEGLFDLETGKFIKQTTHQGWSGASTWTRGLAWALYGFTAVHRLSGEAEFLATARKCADCFIRRSPKDMVPLWDFDLPPDAPQLYDSSAGAIAASGLWDLSEAVAPGPDRDGYRRAALTALETLCSDRFLARPDPAWEGIVKHCIYHFHKKLGVDESVAWGEHFFVEGLIKAVYGSSDAGWCKA
ncbi:MAG TPA: glycoside hydrolase family 88 protein [Gemmataceae bacterium]|jgi:unsaturated chondroitin disaccharide hydrolase|nr:glycoside hydrolase family 88 protein [Gemmataceae bacterium]